jgi:hypothetical protein
MHSVLYLAVVSAFVCALVVLAYRSGRTQKSRASVSWEDLIARLDRVNSAGVAGVAREFLNPTGQQVDPRNDGKRMEPSDIWDMVGGIQGIEVMRQNTAVLIEIAAYIQRWNPEAVIVAEQLRLDAHEMEGYLKRLKASDRAGTLQTWFPFYAQRAVSAYYLMTRRVLALCEISHAGLLPSLQAAL